MNGADLKAALQLREQTDKMLADPDLTGDLLLVALVITALTTEVGQVHAKWSGVAERCGWSSQHIRYVVGHDVPRYEPPREGYGVCTAPMIRRAGLCGKRSSESGYLIDPLTGVMTPWGRCARHRDTDRRAAALAHSDAYRQWRVQGEPRPPANTGGVLPRYFVTDWDQVWDWAAPYRTRADGAKPATPPRPVLRLIPGGAR